MSILEDLSTLYTAVTADEPDDSFLAAAQETCYTAGDDNFPPFLHQAIIDLANRRPREPSEIPDHERGMSWVLQYITPALPGSEYDSYSGRDIFSVSSLGLAIVATHTRERTRTVSVVGRLV